jgi:hypothetical protein
VTIANLDQLVDALGNNSTRVILDKANIANAAAGQQFSLFRATGIPAQGAIPTTAAICNHLLLGAMGFTQQTSPATSYFAWLRAFTSNATMSVEIHDRLAHMGGLNGTLTTAQTVGVDITGTSDNLAARRGDANFSDVSWWLEWYADTGATASNATVNVTYDDASTGNLAVIAVGGTVRAGRLIQLVPAVAGRFIRAVNSVTLSASTATAGNFGVTATRLRAGIDTTLANLATASDWALLGLPEIFNSSCLFPLVTCSTTSTGIVRGQGKIAHG